MQFKLYHDALDASRMCAAAFLGWTVTSSDLDFFLKISIAIATLTYMVGKSCLVWLHFLKERNNEIPAETEDD